MSGEYLSRQKCLVSTAILDTDDSADWVFSIMLSFESRLAAFLTSSILLRLISARPSPAYGAAAAAASAYCTNSDLTYKLSPITAPIQGNGDFKGQEVFKLSIDDTPSGYKQTIDGFGAAVTDATVISFNKLSSNSLDQLLDTLMTPSGAGFSLTRHTTGASDLAPDPPYTYDEYGGMGKEDPSLSNFTFTSQDTAMAQLLAKMKAKNGELTVLGSPWSAPSWMKRNKRLIGTTVSVPRPLSPLAVLEPRSLDAKD